MRALRFREVRCLPEAVPEEGAELRHEPLFLVTQLLTETESLPGSLVRLQGQRLDRMHTAFDRPMSKLTPRPGLPLPAQPPAAGTSYPEARQDQDKRLL